MSNVPKPQRNKNDASSDEFNPFLKVDMIGRKPVTLTLTGTVREVKGGFGDQLAVEVKFKGKTYDWTSGNKINGGNHTRLFKRFGANPKKWKGAVTVQVKEFNGNDYIAVVD